MAYVAPPGEQLPACFGKIPAMLSYWGNSVNGVADCVCAEEAAAKAIYSVNNDMPELFIRPENVAQWATQNGFNGLADPTSVMEAMAQSGMKADDGKVYGDGQIYSVNWYTDAVTLSSAIKQGPVKIGVASAQLNGKVPNPAQNGWIVTGLNPDGVTDHCVNLCGFGSLRSLCAKFGVAPGGIDPETPCYLMFTWGSIGIIDRDSMLAITGEAWLRRPTTVLQGAAGPAPADAAPA